MYVNMVSSGILDFKCAVGNWDIKNLTETAAQSSILLKVKVLCEINRITVSA